MEKNFKFLGALVLANTSSVNAGFIYDVNVAFSGGMARGFNMPSIAKALLIADKISDQAVVDVFEKIKNEDESFVQNLYFYQLASSLSVGFGGKKVDFLFDILAPSVGNATGADVGVSARVNFSKCFVRFGLGYLKLLKGFSLKFRKPDTWACGGAYLSLALAYYIKPSFYVFGELKGAYREKYLAKFKLGVGYTNKKCLAKI